MANISRVKTLGKVVAIPAIFGAGHLVLEPLGVPHGSAELVAESVAATGLILSEQIGIGMRNIRARLSALIAGDS